MDTGILQTVAIAAFVVFILYRRVRRQIGRQALRPKSMTFRVVLFSVICTALLATATPLVETYLSAAAS